mmetsp:Transcript_17933/g.30505  ORF Transcript_17933/g.30505 Transcript_17933/m.30505 type:complete len:285 (+) Transcript_17933:190-1044(+)|eukprot:CAMPEP_0168616944 /NCGR_PEP_ID=MMETSP0449_2-20121227/5290_1 /TAXON_ID=1082188 /ORGANISM="Strombidium rassoulzadegani, Strain ras09" /LENGTH=284 /DNA_ID=CAMNT_0008657749 /DNA_START=166 /DNA_END=1020 /DNA_ORIENTATION=-
MSQFKEGADSADYKKSWDAVSGVTEGAINAYILSLYKPDVSEEQAKALEHLETFWKQIGESKVTSNYALGVPYALVFEKGLYKPDPLYSILDEQFGGSSEFDQEAKNSQRVLNIGITNVNNGTFVSFNEKFKSKHLVDALKASVAYPGIFEPHQAWDEEWFVGSSVWNIDVTAPIMRCKALGFAEKDIVMDVIVDSAVDLKTVDASKFNAFEMGWRTYTLMNYYKTFDGVIKAQKYFPDVQFRSMVGPKFSWVSLLENDLSRRLTQFVPIAYDQTQVKNQIERG